MVDSEGRVNVEDQAQDRDGDGDEDADEAGGNASMQEISSAAKGQENLNQGLSCSKLDRPWLQDDDELREGGKMVNRMDWEEGNGRGSYKREDAGGRGAGGLRKGFGFKRSPPPDQTTTTRTHAAVWACGLVGCGLDAGPPTPSQPVLAPPLAGVACWQPGNLRYPGDGKGALATQWAPGDKAGPKRACAFWALGSVGHQPDQPGGGRATERRSPNCLQGSRAPGQLRPTSRSAEEHRA